MSKVCIEKIGTFDTAAMYLTSGVVSSLVSGIVGNALNRNSGGLGASGAACALTAYATFNNQNLKLPVFLFGPVNAMSYLKFQILYDVVGLVYGGPMPTLTGMKLVDHAAHLGGTACGYLFYAGGFERCKTFQRKLNVCVWNVENWFSSLFS